MWGGGGYTSSNISRAARDTDLILSDYLNELIFNTKKLFSNRLRLPLVTIATSKFDTCFWKRISAVFMQSLLELDGFCYFNEEWPKCSLLWKFRLDIPLDGVLVTVFVPHSFSWFNDLKLGNTISMAPRMVSFYLVFYKLSEKVTFADFQRGEQDFSFWIGIPSQKSETYEPP